MNQAVNNERRKHRRVPLEGTTRVRILAPGPKLDGVTTFSIAEGCLYDVTTVGAFVATSLVVERGQRVELEIVTPGIANPKPLVAIVARCTGRTNSPEGAVPPGLGVRFVTSTQEEQERIRDIVMATLTLDLLDYGYEKKTAPDTGQTMIPPTSRTITPPTSQTITPTSSQTITPTSSQIIKPASSQIIKPKTSQTIVPGAQAHPIQWQSSASGDNEPGGQGELNVRLQADPAKEDPLREALVEDLDWDKALWHLV